MSGNSKTTVNLTHGSDIRNISNKINSDGLHYVSFGNGPNVIMAVTDVSRTKH